MNKLFVAKKPPFTSSNRFLQKIKYQMKLKKLGYSGILDPFASGVLVVASGSYTKLFSHFDLSKKTYIATLWLGAKSSSLDIENIANVEIVEQFPESKIIEVLDSLKGEMTYRPPKFSAKKINGIRAYKLAREDKEIELREIKSKIFEISFVRYCHPFLSFEIVVSAGTYIRSLGEIIAQRLGASGALSSLARISEGDFRFEDYRALDPLDFIPYPKIDLSLYENDIRCGKTIKIRDLKICKNHRYIASFTDFFSIIEFDDFGEIKYIANNIPKSK